MPELLPDPDRAADIVSACRTAAARVDSGEPFAAQVAAIERAAQTFSRHLTLFVDPEGALTPDTTDSGWPPVDLRAVRRRAGGVTRVSRTVDGVATIQIDSLESFDAAEPFLEAAIALVDGAKGVVIDLRANGGGDPATVAFLAGFALGPDVCSLSTVHGRDGVVQWFTNPPALRCLPPDVPVAVLVSEATFSSAEALAYHLQVRDRVVVVGEQTPGGADHVTPIVLTRYVHAHLPIAKVVDTKTGSSWEGTGVKPDIECQAIDAERTGVEWVSAGLCASQDSMGSGFGHD